MSIMFKFPSIIPKSRLTLALVAIFLTATILGSSTSLLYSVQESSTSFLAAQENIVVISNTRATTPFTSAVPLAMIETINQIDGVLLTSPEILLLGSSKGYSVMGRGVYPDNFTQLNEIKVIKGEIPTFDDTVGVALGKNLAKVLGVDIGDTFKFVSAVQTSASVFVVRGIFESGGLLDDEFLVSIIAAAPISRVSAGEVTHIQVKIDTTIISKEEFQEIIFSSFKLDVFLEPRNGTQSDDFAEVTVSLKSGNQVEKKIVSVNGNSSFVLPFGTYVVSTTVPYQTRSSVQTVLLNKNSTIFLETGNYLRNVTLEFEVDNVLVVDGTAKIYSSYTNKLIESIALNGSISTQLPESQYLAQLITVGGEEFWGEFSVNRPNQLVRIYLETKHPTPIIVSPYDGANYSVGQIPLILSKATKYTYYSVDGSVPQQYVEPETLLLSDGKHNVTAYLYNVVSGNYEVISTSEFEINNSLPMVVFSNYTLRENTYFIPENNTSQNQVLSVTLPFESVQIKVSGVLNEILSNYELSIPLGIIQNGIYDLEVIGVFANQTSYSKSYTLVIGNNQPTFFGASLSSPLKLIPGSFLPIYGIQSSDSLRINATILTFNETHAFIPANQSEGLYEVIAELNGSSQTLGLIEITNASDISTVKPNIVHGLVKINNSTIEAISGSVGLSFSSPYNSTIYYSFNGSAWRELLGYLFFSGLNVQYDLNISYLTPWGSRLYTSYIIKMRNAIQASYSNAVEISPSKAGVNISLTWGNNISLKADLSGKPYDLFLTSTNSTVVIPSDLKTPLLLRFGLENTSIELNSKFYSLFYSTSVKDFNFEQAMLVKESLFLADPQYLKPGKYLVVYEGQIKTVATVPFASVSLLGPITSNDSRFSLQIEGNYTAVELLNTTIPYDFNPLSKILVVNVTQTQELTLIIKNVAGSLSAKKITLYPNLSNISVQIDVIDQTSHSVIPSNVTITYEDDLSTVNLPNYNGTVIRLRPGPLRINVTTSQGTQIIQGLYLENTNMTVKFGNAIVTLAVLDPNTGQFVSGARVSIKKQYSSAILQQKTTPGSFWISFALPPGKYSITAEWLGRSSTNLIDAMGEVNITLELPALLANLTLFFHGVSEMPDNIQLLHVATGKIFAPSEIREDLLRVIFTNVYLGDVVITYQISDRIETKIIELYSNAQTYNIYIELSNIAIKAKDLSKLASLGGIQLSESDKYLNSFISGPLELVKTVFMAELVLVTFVVLINGIAVMRGVVSETRREIETLEYLGSSVFHIFVGIMKKIIAYGLVVAMIGTALGIVLTDLIVRGFDVRLFSHTFYPSYDLRVYLITGLLDIIVYTLSFFIAYHIEMRDTQNINK